MKITNLNPLQYKRFFAFGCSYTNYRWPTWADIIGRDIPLYENWGFPGAGNYFIFNSVVEAHSRYKFTKDDLVIIMWTSTSREDRYSAKNWLHATISEQEKIYGKDWLKKFATDTRANYIRDFAYIKSTQVLLESTGCDWSNLVAHPLVKLDSKKLSFNTKEDMYDFWYTQWHRLCSGLANTNVFEEDDVIDVYKDIFLNISASYENFENNKDINKLNTVNGDTHPMPIDVLKFIDQVWPNNTLSQQTRDYIKSWDYNKCANSGKTVLKSVLRC